jgi:uncharacterized protein with NAD-binding domain and iron-sulfur cluster
MTRRRIAVISGGVSGITAGYVLSHTDDVILFEAGPRLGGHAAGLPLTRGTGACMTDRRMAESRPQYADYAARTSGFIPLPPKRRAAGAAPRERA